MEGLAAREIFIFRILFLCPNFEKLSRCLCNESNDHLYEFAGQSAVYGFTRSILKRLPKALKAAPKDHSPGGGGVQITTAHPDIYSNFGRYKQPTFHSLPGVL